MEKPSVADLPEIMDMMNVAYRVERDPDNSVSFKKVDRFRSLEEAAKHLDGMWIVRKDGRITGAIYAEMLPDEEPPVVQIGPLAVHVDHQGQGIASRMLDFTESLASVCQIRVVSSRTDILPIYRKRGYVQIHSMPLEHVLPESILTISGLKMLILRKNRG